MQGINFFRCSMYFKVFTNVKIYSKNICTFTNSMNTWFIQLTFIYFDVTKFPFISFITFASKIGNTINAISIKTRLRSTFINIYFAATAYFSRLRKRIQVLVDTFDYLNPDISTILFSNLQKSYLYILHCIYIHILRHHQS